MIRSFQKQPQIKILPAFNADGVLRLRETDLQEITNLVRGLLPQHVDWDFDVTITLLEKNLKIMADMALMKKGLTYLIENTMDGLRVSSNSGLNTNQISCEVETLLDGFSLIEGACTFVYLADTAVDLHEKTGERICEPFFTIKTNSGKSLGLPIAYRMIKGPKRYSRGVTQWREANIYLPLNRQEIVNMMSIPIDVACGR